MRLHRIGLDGFGCLRNFEAEFAPGLNVIYGLNEAGKSTLQQAICAMLYGFFEGERSKPDEKRRHERFRPWADGANPAPYRGTLDYEMENGDTFEVRRDFASPDIPTQLVDLALGADVTSRFGQGRHGNVPFARRQLGMSRGVFQSCAFIAQGEVFAASQGASPREIGDAIAAMADSARRDVSASAALSQLDALMLRIGSDRARTAELPKARENLREAEAELAALDRTRAAIAARSQELERGRDQRQAMERETVALQARYLFARKRALTRRLDALDEAGREIEVAASEHERLGVYESFPAELRDRVVTLSDRRRGAAGRVEAARGSLAARQESVGDEDRLRFETLRVSVGALTPEIIADLETLAYEPPAVAPAPGFIKRLFSRLIGIITRLLRRVFARRAEAPPVEKAAPDKPVVSRQDARALLERYHHYIALKPAIEALEEALARLQREENALAGVLDELSALVSAKAPEQIEAATAAFLEGCTHRAAFDAAGSALRETQQRREALLGGRSIGDIRTQLATCEVRLEEILTDQPGLEDADSNDSTPALEEQLKALDSRRHELDIACARLEEEVRGAIGDQRARADVEEDVERWRREAQRLERRRQSATIAREVIDEAMTSVYRDFAPAVSSFLSDGFAHVTEGRYQRAHVDPSTLEVSLLLPETHQVIKDPPVSRGTLSLAYILMRIGLAQHMSSVGEPVPLVLDDPLVDLDEHRLGLTLEFIGALSERMQVLLFTKDPAVRRWLENNTESDRRRLHMLSPLVPATTAV